MEELIPMSFDWKVFDSSLAVARKEDFQRLLGAIDDGSWDKGERTSLEGRASDVFTSYVGFFDSLEICQIEYGTHNPFNVPEDPAGSWSDILENMEARMEVLSGIAARKERASTGKALNTLVLEGEDGEQHDRILDHLATLHARAEYGEIDGVSGSDVEALAKLYAEIRIERPKASEYDRLEEILKGVDMPTVVEIPTADEIKEAERVLKLVDMPTVEEVQAAEGVLMTVALLEDIKALNDEGSLTTKDILEIEAALTPDKIEEAERVLKTAEDLKGVDMPTAEEVQRAKEVLIAADPKEVNNLKAKEQLKIGKIDWFDLTEELGYLEIPEARPTGTEWDAAWEVSRAVVQGLRANEMSQEELVAQLGKDPGVVKRREMIAEWGDEIEVPELEGEEAKQDLRILAGFDRLYAGDRKKEVEELELLYVALRFEWYDVRRFAALERILGSKEIDWLAVVEEMGYLEMPEKRPHEGDHIHLQGLGWFASRLFKSEEIDLDQALEDVYRLGDGKLTWGDFLEESGPLLWSAMKNDSEESFDWGELKAATGYSENNIEPNSIGWRHAAWVVTQLFSEKPLTRKQFREKIGYEENDQAEITGTEAAWLVSRVLAKKELAWEPIETDLVYLANPENRASIGGLGMAWSGGKAFWRTQKWIKTEGITWKNLEKMVGTKKPYEDNDEVVSSKHLVWLGIKLFESEEMSFAQFDTHLTALVDPENRSKIGWGQVAKMGAKALWRAMTGGPSKNKKQEEDLIMMDSITKKLPWLKSKLKSVDGATVAKLALGLVALIGIGLIAYNFEAIRNALTGGPAVPNAPAAPVTPIPVTEPPPPVVTKPVPPVKSHQGLHFHNGVWGWGN